MYCKKTFVWCHPPLWFYNKAFLNSMSAPTAGKETPKSPNQSNSTFLIVCRRTILKYETGPIWCKIKPKTAAAWLITLISGYKRVCQDHASWVGTRMRPMRSLKLDGHSFIARLPSHSLSRSTASVAHGRIARNEFLSTRNRRNNQQKIK